MILKKEENSTGPSLVFSAIDSGEACLAFLDIE
jgi:hypothetical protein